MAEQQPARKDLSLPFKHHYNHFLLLHDFLHKLTKSQAKTSDYFNLQIEVYNSMNSSIKIGERMFQGAIFGSLCYYFMKGHSIALKFVSGFFFVYWYNHVMTLGSYAGAFARIPALYKKTSQYYENHPQQINLIDKLNIEMDKSPICESPQILLSELFDDNKMQKSYVKNDFFIKNKEKYLPKDLLQEHHANDKKLEYLDSFLSRYIYYSFKRWCTRLGQFMSIEETN